MQKKDRTGETYKAVNGQTITIIAYTNAQDIDVRFEDGTVVRGVQFSSIKRGNVRNPNFDYKEADRKERLGQTIMQNCGMECTIIQYNNAHDMTVKFIDGKVLEHKYYADFLAGKIINPNTRKYIVGSRWKAFNGQWMTIITIHPTEKGCNTCDVRFEDGTIVKDVNVGCVGSGTVANPNVRSLRLGNHMGEKKMNVNGQMMEIIGYRCAHDIDVRFEDGTIVKGTSYSGSNHPCWIDGTILNPSLPWTSNEMIRKARQKIGQQAKNKLGQTMTIIMWRNFSDMDVRIEETGQVFEHVWENSFNRGTIGTPQLHLKDLSSLVGETKVMSNGLKAEITDTGDSDNLMVLFEDGERVVMSHEAWKYGRCGHHSLCRSRWSDYMGYKAKFIMEDKKGSVLYKCVDKETGERSLLTAHQIMESRGKVSCLKNGSIEVGS